MLQRLFDESRDHIIKEVLKGIELFDKIKWTAVCTDWSNMGVGYFMSQKYCSCLEITLTCCATGWKVFMVGSSFNSPAESNYAPIVGECLGMARQTANGTIFISHGLSLSLLMACKLFQNVLNTILYHFVKYFIDTQLHLANHFSIKVGV